MNTPICKIARENGGEVPLSCLFKCPRNCIEEHRKANPPPPRVRWSPPPADPDEFEVLTSEAPRK